MPRAFATIAFTSSVKAEQSKQGSRESYARFELESETGAKLGTKEREFIALRDSFYQATAAENGWPYVQHRGGAKGFLKVLDEQTLGFADFSGNKQYLSVGNLNTNDRISLILMDYRNRRRLKIWGRVQLIDNGKSSDLLSKLEEPSYSARIERGFIIQVEAFDWNCPQHITPRYTEMEITALLAPLQDEIKELKEKLADIGNK